MMKTFYTPTIDIYGYHTILHLSELD